MTEDEQVLARLAALDAELRADAAVQADLKARQAERIRADQASGEVPTILVDDEAEAATKAQRRAEAIARLKAARAAKGGGEVALATVPAAAPPADPKAAARAAAIARLKAERAAKNAAAAKAAAPVRTAEEDDAELEALLARRDPPPKPKPAPAAKAKPAPKPKAKAAPAPDLDDLDEPRGGLGDALALAGKAAAVKDELARPTGAGEKSWLASGLLSLLLGPVGWLYAGAWREAIPASAAWIGIGAIGSLLPTFLLLPVLMVAMPVSAIVGVVYAAKFNRAGRRQRILGPNPAPAKLKAGGGRALGPGKRRG